MTYFVRIHDATTVRRELLEGSRDIIMSLKGYELFLDLRDQKKEVIMDLQKVVADLHILMKQLQQALPEKSLKEVEQFLPHEKKPVKAKVAKKSKKATKKAAKKEASVPVSETAKLDQTLKLIEQRLAELK